MTPITKKALASRIRVLPEDVAAKIAAGEVVERPASVLKELLENCLDAGATKVRVWVEKAGRKLIRVTDDGCGMSPQDMRASILRHSTSKITSLEDLDRLATYGFRGEALYSIAAVSRLALSSYTKGAGEGLKIEFEGGKVVSESPAPPLPGTTVDIKALFWNTPARAKFLKSDGTERSHLTRVLEECALAHPEIMFGYTLEGADIFHLPGRPLRKPAENFLARAQAVLGKEIFTPLTATLTRGDLKVIAYLAPPDGIGYARNMQHWFVNRRPVASRLLSQALYKAYEPYRAPNQHPYCLVFIEMPPSQYDVNVHPAKREIRFQHERDLFDALHHLFSQRLLEAKPVPSAFSKPVPYEITPTNVFKEGDALVMNGTAPELVNEAKTTYAGTLSPQSPLASALFKPADSRQLSTRCLGQLEQTYLVFEDEGGLLLLDQHAAAERILYEKFLDELDAKSLNVQKMMLPVPLDLRPSEAHKLEAYADDLKALGYELEWLGKNSLALSSQPAAFEMKGSDLRDVFSQLLEELPQSASGGREKLRDLVAHRACRKAIKAHESLSADAAVRLLADLRQCADGSCCPHGRPTTLVITRSELARRFKRPGPPPL